MMARKGHPKLVRYCPRQVTSTIDGLGVLANPITADFELIESHGIPKSGSF
jgi:shikimate 5-dehydrogenase